jgi:hypothetical protein
MRQKGTWTLASVWLVAEEGLFCATAYFHQGFAATGLIAPVWPAIAGDQPNGQPANDCGTAFVWQTMVPTPANVPAFNGHTDTIPNIVGRLGSRIEVTDANAKGFYETQGWGPDFIVPTRPRHIPCRGQFRRRQHLK